MRIKLLLLGIRVNQTSWRNILVNLHPPVEAILLILRLLLRIVATKRVLLARDLGNLHQMTRLGTILVLLILIR